MTEEEHYPLGTPADVIVTGDYQWRRSIDQTMAELQRHGYQVSRIAVLETWAELDEMAEHGIT